MKLMIANALLGFLPPTRMFAIKRVILNWLGLRVGRGTSVCGGVKFYGAGQISIGQDCWIGLGCRFYVSRSGNVLIGDRCDIAPDVSFVCGTHDMGPPDRRAGRGRAANIEVGSGCWIGTGTTLLGGCRLGDSSIVGAASLLTAKTYPDNSLLLGVPAKLTRELLS